jgi:IS30 family transposase
LALSKLAYFGEHHRLIFAAVLICKPCIPKKQNFNDFNDLNIKDFQIKINNHPRKLLNFESPVERFDKKLH